MITAENVEVFYRKGFRRGQIRALDGFSLNVREGDVCALLGPNGAGKSTAMYCLLGLIQPKRGTVTVIGQSPRPGSPLFEQIAYLPEEPHYHSHLTVREAVAFYASLYRNGHPSSRVDQAIERVGLAEFADLKLRQCSKGMKQKVGIAQCLVNNPRLVFLDEPTRGLDPVMVKEFRDILLEMRRNGATILINSHVLSEVEQICNRVAIMRRGKVIAEDEMGRLKSLNLEAYRIETSRPPFIPPYLDVKMEAPDSLKGEIPAVELGNFFRFAEEHGLKVYECSLKKVSLEEVFLNAIGDTH